MFTRTLHSLGGGTLMGPCPGCDAWQVDYLPGTPATYCTDWTFTPEGPQVDISGWVTALDSVLRDHYDECPGLRELVGSLPD